MLSVVIAAAAAAAPLAQGKSIFRGPIDIEPKGVPKFCSLEPDVGPCDGSFPKWYFRPKQGCFKFEYGGCEGNQNRFDTEEECRDVCAGLNLPPCKQPIIPGPCKGSFKRWAFDQKEGKCVDFIYGGCGANDNNYETEEECNKACDVKPVPVCEQKPGVVGPCEALFRRYTYNQKTQQCEMFTWGGCGGNENNFETLEECEKTCDVDPVDPCTLPIVPGPCRASIPSWGFDEEKGKCVMFTYGGCQGNANRFDTQEACDKKCPPVKPENPCELPIVPGPCKAYIPSWAFDEQKGKCRRFVYGGCGGNANRFSSKKACNKACPSKPVDRCSLPIVTGPCKGKFPKWGFDTKQGKCVKFVYGGCKGNKNRFKSQKSCEKKCGKSPKPNEICLLPIYPPKQEFFCLAAIPRWTYNAKNGACVKFTYGGCGGTANIFETEKECLNTCRGVGDVHF